MAFSSKLYSNSFFNYKCVSRAKVGFIVIDCRSHPMASLEVVQVTVAMSHKIVKGG